MNLTEPYHTLTKTLPLPAHSQPYPLISLPSRLIISSYHIKSYLSSPQILAPCSAQNPTKPSRSYNDALFPTHLLDNPRPHLVHGFDQSRVPKLGSERRENLEVEQPLCGRGALFFNRSSMIR